eukprot:5706866-Amphidinium_carterae.2
MATPAFPTPKKAGDYLAAFRDRKGKSVTRTCSWPGRKRLSNSDWVSFSANAADSWWSWVLRDPPLNLKRDRPPCTLSDILLSWLRMALSTSAIPGRSSCLRTRTLSWLPCGRVWGSTHVVQKAAWIVHSQLLCWSAASFHAGIEIAEASWQVHFDRKERLVRADDCSRISLYTCFTRWLRHMLLDSVSASNPSATGGIVMAVKKSYLAQFAAVHREELVEGRAGDVHLQPSETATWAQVATTLKGYVQALMQSTILLIGDLNMDLDVADRINTDSGVLCGMIGHRARLWSALFPSASWCNVVPGFSLPLCQAAGLRCELLTPGVPPHGSDHHPIGLRWQEKTFRRDLGLDRWMTDHPKWGIMRYSWLTLLDSPDTGWQQRWSNMLLAFRCAADDDLRHLRDEIPAGFRCLDKHLASVALRHQW